MKLGLALAVTLRKQYPQEWKPEGDPRMLGDHASYEAIVAGRERAEIEALWQERAGRFLAIAFARGICSMTSELNLSYAAQ